MGEISFRNPPLVEVVCGCVFHVPDRFALPHIGSFWEEVKSEFPIASEAPPLFDPTEGHFAFEAQLPLPRTWLHNTAQTALLQLQRDRFIYNWKRGDGQTPYPRFGVVFNEFSRLYSIFRAHLEREGVGLTRVREFELTYANHIPLAGLSVSDYLIDHKRDVSRPRFLPEPIGFGWTTAYALSDENSRLSVTAQKARAMATGTDILKLDISVKGYRENDMSGWFDMAHQQVTRAFVDLTDEHVQKELWGKSE